MTDFEAVAARRCEGLGQKSLEAFYTQLDRVVGGAKIRLDIMDGRPVGIFRRVLAESVLPPNDSPKITYVYHVYRRWAGPIKQLGTGSPLDRDAVTEGARQARQVIGAFWEIREPPWDFRKEGKDLIYVSSVENSEYPNPTVHFISVDPQSKVYGRATQMTAGDIGFIPCCYGNHSYACARPDLGRVELPDFPTNLADLALSAPANNEVGVELLARAIQHGSTLPKPGFMEDVARFYGAQVAIYQAS